MTIVIDTLEGLERFKTQQNKQTLEEHPHYNYYLTKAYDYYERLTSTGEFEWRPYQPRYAATYCCRRRNISALIMGSGKTLIAVLKICALYDTRLDNMTRGSIQIIAPSELSIKARWSEELYKFDIIRRNVSFLKDKRDIDEADKPIWIYHHDFPKLKLGKRKGNRDYVSKVLNKASLLVVDEAHQLKESTNRSRHITYLIGRSKRVLLMSGTISDGRLDLIHFLCNTTYGVHWPFNNKKEFRNKYSSKKNIKTNYVSGFGDESNRTMHKLSPAKISSYSKLIQRYIHRVGYNNNDIKDYVSIPHRETVVEPVYPSPHHKDYYKEVIEREKHNIELIKKYNNNNMKAKALQLLHPIINASNCPPEDIENNKLNLLLHYVEEKHAKGEKTAVVCEGVESSRLVTLALKEYYRVVRMYAEDENYKPPVQKPKERKEVVNEFLFNEETKVGVFSIHLASESIDLTSASQIIFYDYPWSSTKLQQSLFRVVRPGNKKDSVRAVYLKNKGFVDEHQQNLLAEKLDSLNLMLDFDTSSNWQDNVDLEEVVKNVIG